MRNGATRADRGRRHSTRATRGDEWRSTPGRPPAKLRGTTPDRRPTPGAGTTPGPPLALVALTLALLLPLLLAASPAAAQITVGSKNFAESRLLGEMFAQLLEARTELTVERRLGLAGTQVCFEALRTGAIDLYPEYTGTGLASVLGEPPPDGGGTGAGARSATLGRVRSVFLERWDLHWLAPLGFENAYELAVPRAVAEARGLATISDLAAVAGELDAGLGYEFAERPDGLPGLAATYGLAFRSVRSMQQSLKVQAAARGEIDVLDVYTTDGRIRFHDLVVLDDDRGFFPPYEAAPLLRGATLETHPEVGAVLGLLGGALDAESMRGLNLRLQEGGESEAAVAADALAELGLVARPTDAGHPAERTSRAGLPAYLWAERADLVRRTGEHLVLSALALLLGAVVAIPGALLLERRRAWAEPVLRLLGTTQTIPSIALLAFAIPLLGVGFRPALAALWLYSLFPMARNTYTGVRDADLEAVDAATALGMTPTQVLTRVRLPLAAPVILAGVRTSAVLTVGTATLAAFIGAGGLGEPIVTGLQLADSRRILSGALPAAGLAVLVDATLGWVERRLTLNARS